VLASDYGGLREAKLGVPHCLPVAPLRLGELVAMDYSVRDQPLAPWLATIDELTSSVRTFTSLAEQSRVAALRFCNELTWSRVFHEILG
jgi:hypothetical protein